MLNAAFLRRPHIREPKYRRGQTPLGGEMTTAGKALAARFEISIDGVPRSYRDRREIAVEAAGGSWSSIRTAPWR